MASPSSSPLSEHTIHIKGFFSELKIDVADLIKNINTHCGGWQAPTRMFGRKWCRGIVKGMDKDIDRIIDLVETNIPSLQVEQIFANLYENGTHKTGFHSDNYGCDIISASFGGTRPFHFRKIGTTKISDKILLKDGDLFQFDEWVNKHYHHAIPQTKTYTDPRVNLTMFVRPVEKKKGPPLTPQRKTELTNAIFGEGICQFDEDELDGFEELLKELGINAPRMELTPGSD